MPCKTQPLQKRTFCGGCASKILFIHPLNYKIMSLRDFWAAEAAALRDTSALLHKDALSYDSNVFGANRQNPVLQACDATWPITNISEVRSFEWEKQSKACESAWELAKSKAIKAQKTKEQTFQDVGSRISPAQKAVVDKLLSNSVWGYDMSHLLEGTWTGIRYYSNLHKEVENKHIDLITQLTSTDLNGFKEDMNQLKDEFRKFGDKYDIYRDEKDEAFGYCRFDKYYSGKQLQQILDKIETIYKVKFISSWLVK